MRTVRCEMLAEFSIVLASSASANSATLAIPASPMAQATGILLAFARWRAASPCTSDIWKAPHAQQGSGGIMKQQVGSTVRGDHPNPHAQYNLPRHRDDCDIDGVNHRQLALLVVQAEHGKNFQIQEQQQIVLGDFAHRHHELQFLKAGHQGGQRDYDQTDIFDPMPNTQCETILWLAHGIALCGSGRF